MTLIAGIDGCRSEWLCITMDTRDRSFSAQVASTDDFLPLRWSVAGIDIPIGLPDTGPREADFSARAFLKPPRASSVFPCPVWAAVGASSWEEMNAITRKVSGCGASKQSYAILRKVREVNNLVRGNHAAASCFIEVHPEVSFAGWRGQPMQFSKKKPQGKSERRELISAYFGADALSAIEGSLKGLKVPFDDIADAFAALWSAERYSQGKAVSLPNRHVYDSQGLPMVIWY